MMDLTQLHVTGALGALGGIMEMEAYDKIKISGSNLSRRKYFNSYSRWRLTKGPNDIWLIISDYSSRHGHHKQLSYLNHHEWSELLIKHCLFKPAIRVAMASGSNRYSFLPNCRTDKFRRLQLLFWIKQSFRKENILEPKNWYR